MLFQSRWYNASYVIKPTVTIIYPGQGQETRRGLRAEFRGDQRLFDSESAAEKHGWTEDDRKWVEEYLVRHQDFGSGLYLAPGERMPDWLAQKVGTTKIDDAAKRNMRRCADIRPGRDGLVHCSEQPAVGSDFCAAHDPNKQKIRQGMLNSMEEGT